MGCYYKAIPVNKELRVFIKDEGIYHPMKGIVELQANNKWYFGPLILNFKQEVILLVCLVDKEVGEKLDNRINLTPINKIGPSEGIVSFGRVKAHSE